MVHVAKEIPLKLIWANDEAPFLFPRANLALNPTLTHQIFWRCDGGLLNLYRGRPPMLVIANAKLDLHTSVRLFQLNIIPVAENITLKSGRANQEAPISFPTPNLALEQFPHIAIQNSLRRSIPRGGRRCSSASTTIVASSSALHLVVVSIATPASICVRPGSTTIVPRTAKGGPSVGHSAETNRHVSVQACGCECCLYLCVCG
mmetsp:Transcript_3969/g.9386  ORF Transcript_3969/g.9386 Transcript_3969/m.9386 type:complete len:204 (-) Transcript_3969:130-741(-)